MTKWKQWREETNYEFYIWGIKGKVEMWGTDLFMGILV